MSWDGYLTLDGVEVANGQRFEAYAGDRSWFHPVYRTDGVGHALSETYTDPVTDAAPWWDPDVPASGDLYGFYPVALTGFDDSSRTISTVESTREGGIPGRVRHATKEVNVAGFIAGASEAAVEYGLIWLRRVLLGGLCSPLDARKQALGTEMSFFGYAPPSEALAGEQGLSAQAVLDSITRTYRAVVVSTGPSVISRRRLACGDYIAQVQFTARCGDPRVYSNPLRVFSNLFDLDGIVWGSVADEGTVQTTTFEEVTCGVPLWEPLYDPLCAAAITPPTPPNVPMGCWSPPISGTTYGRTIVTIPATNFPTFSEMMPLITLNNAGDNIRSIRIRFYRDPDGTLDVASEPCDWVSDIVLSFMPAGVMDIDGSREQVHFVTTGGHTRRADSLVFGTDQRPMTWPVLDCGTQYLMTIDTLGLDDPPIIDLDLVARTV